MTHRDDTRFGARQLVDMAVACGRCYQSPQTGLVHLHYGQSDENFRDTIPIKENLLMALALFRTHALDNAREAMKILDKMLHFQDPENHNFPVYIHEYGHTRDRFLPVHLLGSLFWITKNYEGVLEHELKSRLRGASQGLVDYVAGLTEVPEPLVLPVGAILTAWGKLLGDQSLQKRGEASLKAFASQGVTRFWMVPRILGEWLSFLQMCYENIDESPFKSFWQYLADTWHVSSHTYVGPGLDFQQWEGEPKATLYDLYMGYLGGSYSYRALKMAPFQLGAALIQPMSTPIPKRVYPFRVSGVLEGRKWEVVQRDQFGFSLIEQLEPLDPSLKYLFHPLLVVWGDETNSHSFVCQGGRFLHFDYSLSDSDEMTLNFHVDSAEGMEDFSKAIDVTFFIDDCAELKKYVAGKPASVFQLGNKVELSGEGVHLELNFECQGSSKYCGHIQPGNRPAQAALFGDRRFCAFDSQIALRAVQREGPENVRVKIKFG